VILVNSDDWLESDHIALAVRALLQSGADFAFGNMIVHAPEGQIAHCLMGDEKYARTIRYKMPALNHPTIVCRRRLYEQFGLFDLRLRSAMDYEWLLRVHRAGAVGVYVSSTTSHMSLQGESDRNYLRATAEVREISILHGLPSLYAWLLYCLFVGKSMSQRMLGKILHRRLHEKLRRIVNAQYRFPS